MGTTMTIISQQTQRIAICVCTCLRTRIITRIVKWVSQKAAYRAGIRDEVENKPLRQYRDPGLQIAYMFGRVEVRDNHWQRGRPGD
jgi:hypothetical protein